MTASTDAYARPTVLGAGAWGSALVIAAARGGTRPVLWARRPEQARAISQSRRNADYIGDVLFPDEVTATDDLETALARADAALLVVPAAATGPLAREVHARLGPDAPLVICAKGFDPEGDRLLSDSVTDIAPGRPVLVLSGPSFADETARGLPTAVAVAGVEPGGLVAARRLAATLAGPAFRCVVSEDPIGVQIGGAIKNVIAIACGVAHGAGLGENARAALLTFGLEECATLSQALGGRRETALGLAGAGDMILSCVSEGSRNYSFGMRLGAGRRRDAATTEGVRSAAAISRIAAAKGVEAPISRAVCRVVHEAAPVEEAFAVIWRGA